MALKLGCIADDFTGGTDLANNLVRAGMRTVQVIGVGAGPLPDDVDAVVVALKSRTASVEQAVAESLAAARWLSQGGRPQIYFKVCSTFDSTPAGNIGPVGDALCDALGTGLNVVTPAYPRNARTVYQGHLFVGESLLSDTGMRTHPLTPMTDSNLVRVLGSQTRHRVGLLASAVVAQGAAAIGERLAALKNEGCRHVIADAIDDAHLQSLGAAITPQMLATGGSGLAAGMAASLRAGAGGRPAATLDWPQGPGVILAGSCSTATLGQLEQVGNRLPRRQLDPVALARDAGELDAAI
ncbi:MAG: four-carbon acid sugar kinase family protein, partial [Rubrivivax sp.]|nr:four-carbon acid sugar kinase family protein [Rubrivivax sp.]